MDDAQAMNFELPEELRMLKDTVRKFVDKELIPIEREACDGHKLKPEMRRHLEARARELGLANYDVPQEHGGLGLGLLAKVVVWAEMARSIALPSRAAEIFGPNVSPILYHLSDDQKRASCCRPSAARCDGASPKPSPTPAAIPAACAPPRRATATITSSPA